jgi:RNA polymerase sigma-70 factor (ECF subfamily)
MPDPPQDDARDRTDDTPPGERGLRLADPEAEAEARYDHELIRRAQRGEEDAFAELVRRHEGRAWRVARNLVGNAEDARDVAQEAFLRVFRSLDRFDFQHEFTTWLYRIVTNLGIDHLRRRRKLVSTAGVADDEEYELDLPDVEGERPEDRLDAAETAAEVRECIDALAPHFRVVMALRELEGLSCAEIARIVGATNVTVRWRLHRGRKLFQEEWERRGRQRALRPDPDAGTRAPDGPEGASPTSDARLS